MEVRSGLQENEETPNLEPICAALKEENQKDAEFIASILFVYNFSVFYLKLVLK